jgi:hypothetical protein
LGGEVPAGTGRYARRSGSREIVLLNATQSRYLTMSLEDFYDMKFFPLAHNAQEPFYVLVGSALLEQGNDVIEVRQRSQEEIAGLILGSSFFHLLQPMEFDCNDFSVKNNFLDPIISIAPDRVIASPLPGDLSPYGLDDPARLTVTDTEGWTGTLLIGSVNAELGGRYVVIEGHDAVLLDPRGDYRFLGASFSQLRSPSVWMHDIKLVSAVTFELMGVTRELRIEHDIEEETVEGWLDGEEIGQTNTRRLYMAALRVSQDGDTNADIPTGTPDYRFTMHFMEGGTDVIELYRLSDVQFLIVHNGESTGLFINRMTVQQNLLSRFEYLDRGENIPNL